MAKNEHKKDLKTAENNQQEMVVAPQKMVETNQPEKAKEIPESKKSEPHGAHKSQETAPKKGHGWRKFVFFVFLLLLGGAAFLALQLEQTKKQNAEVLQKLQAAYDLKITEVNTKVVTLQKEVNALKERPIVEHAAGVSENQLNQKLAALREEMTRVLSADTAKTEDKKVTITAEDAMAQTVSVEQQREIAKLAANEKKTQEVLLASGAIIVRDLAEQGVNFAYEAEVLQILARGNELAQEYVRTVRTFANTGITGKHDLVKNFDKIFAALNDTQLKASATEQNAEKLSWFARAWNVLVRAVVVKQSAKKPVFMPENDEVLELVHEGQLQRALIALTTSEKYAKLDSKPLNAWKVQVENYLEFNKAVSGLIMNALANIRLKEMEHAAQ